VKLAISNIAWAAKDDHFIFSHLRESGFSGLEIAPGRLIPVNPYAKIKQAKELSRSIKKNYGLIICSMQSILFGRKEQIFSSAEEREVILVYARKAVDFAAALSCPNIVFGAPQNRFIESCDQYEVAVDFFYQLGEYARLRDTAMAIEANPVIYGTNFINTTEEAFQLAGEVKSKGFMVNVDLGTMIYNQEDPEKILADISCVNHIHISEPYLVPLERRSMHKVLFTLMEQKGYKGYLSIEMKNQGDPKVVIDTLKYIGGLCDASEY
jgi:sugar phosphate isomerase/epimerase